MPTSKRRRPLAAAGTRPLKIGSTSDPETPVIFTCGYSGHTPESYLALVSAAGAKQVIDVRSFPFSRKPGFSKAALAKFLESNGLTYVHLPALGAPRALLKQKKSGSTMKQIAPAYRQHLAGQTPALREAERLALDTPSVLLCL